MPTGESFYDVLTAAINDLLEYGYDDPVRVEQWQRRLREATLRTWGTLHDVERHLRESLQATFRRLVDGDSALRAHSGISRLTYDKLKPHLRSELDRRLLAATDLIRLNREEAVARMGRRWVGWATSIPVGGPSEVKRAELKQEIKKPLQRLPFEERRLFIDQGHKMAAAVSATIALDGGALAGKWRHVHQPHYDARPEHLARDGKVFLVRDSWAHKRGFLTADKDQWTDSIEQPAELPFCRCSYVWLYRLRQLPDEFITAKGREAMTAARELREREMA
jgi:hypothetical protein